MLSLLLAVGLLAVTSVRTGAGGGIEAVAGAQQARQVERGGPGSLRLRYLLYLPRNYRSDGKEWPLLLFLHGAGETGDDLDRVKRHGPPRLIDKGKQFPFIVVSPQTPHRGWNVAALTLLSDEVQAKYRVDPDRVYLTGLSMGGFGTWALAAAHPERFATLVPVCGGGNPADAARLKDLPIWVFHGAKDPTVPPQRSEEMVRALEKAGAKRLRFTLYPDAAHDSWTRTYDDPRLYEWLLEQKRSTTGRR